jgi:hypothetical protein
MAPGETPARAGEALTDLIECVGSRFVVKSWCRRSACDRCRVAGLQADELLRDRALHAHPAADSER